MIANNNDAGTTKNPAPPTSASGVNSAGYSSSIYDVLQAISESNNSWNQSQVDAVNAFNAEEAAKNRRWQERMARNAHQYEVEDLIKAGLNPILSAGGQGASVGSGAVASGQKAVADNTYGQGLISLMGAMISASSAMSIAQLNNETKLAVATMQSDTSKFNTEVNNDVKTDIAKMNNATDLFKGVMQMLGSMMASGMYRKSSGRYNGY